MYFLWYKEKGYLKSMSLSDDCLTVNFCKDCDDALTFLFKCHCYPVLVFIDTFGDDSTDYEIHERLF